jgi:hypothetical protein
MTIYDTALKAAEMVGLRDRTPLERARASYNDLSTQATGLASYIPTQSNVDWTSLTIGLIVGTAVGFGLGLYMHESMQPAMRTARRQMKKAQETVQELPQRLNITRMEETPVKTEA